MSRASARTGFANSQDASEAMDCTSGEGWPGEEPVRGYKALQNCGSLCIGPFARKGGRRRIAECSGYLLFSLLLSLYQKHRSWPLPA